MTRSRDQDRLDNIERLLDELREREADVAIIVEGFRDVASLEGLDVPGPIIKINVGSSLLNFCESVAREYASFIILTDWDRTGKQLAVRLEELLRSTGAEVNVIFRRRLGGSLPYQIHDVESIYGHVERLRKAVGIKERRPPPD